MSALAFGVQPTQDGNVEPWSHVMVVAVAGAENSTASMCRPHAMQ
jgi:hypothetical protein